MGHTILVQHLIKLMIMTHSSLIALTILQASRMVWMGPFMTLAMVYMLFGPLLALVLPSTPTSCCIILFVLFISTSNPFIFVYANFIFSMHQSQALILKSQFHFVSFSLLVCVQTRKFNLCFEKPQPSCI